MWNKCTILLKTYGIWHVTGQKGPITEIDRRQAFISHVGTSSTVGNSISSKVFKVLQSDFLDLVVTTILKSSFPRRSQYLNRRIWDLGYMVSGRELAQRARPREKGKQEAAGALFQPSPAHTAQGCQTDRHVHTSSLCTIISCCVFWTALSLEVWDPWARHGGTCLQPQHLGGQGQRGKVHEQQHLWLK